MWRTGCHKKWTQLILYFVFRCCPGTFGTPCNFYSVAFTIFCELSLTSSERRYDPWGHNGTTLGCSTVRPLVKMAWPLTWPQWVIPKGRTAVFEGITQCSGGRWDDSGKNDDQFDLLPLRHPPQITPHKKKVLRENSESNPKSQPFIWASKKKKIPS